MSTNLSMLYIVESSKVETEYILSLYVKILTLIMISFLTPMEMCHVKEGVYNIQHPAIVCLRMLKMKNKSNYLAQRSTQF